VIRRLKRTVLETHPEARVGEHKVVKANIDRIRVPLVSVLRSFVSGRYLLRMLPFRMSGVVDPPAQMLLVRHLAQTTCKGNHLDIPNALHDRLTCVVHGGRTDIGAPRRDTGIVILSRCWIDEA